MLKSIKSTDSCRVNQAAWKRVNSIYNCDVGCQTQQPIKQGK